MNVVNPGGEDPDVRELLDDTREDLIDAILLAASGRSKVSCSALRGVMEGLFSALLYRQQAISLNLWSTDTSHHMVHSFFEDKHEFYKYFRKLFEDARFRKDYPGVTYKQVIKEAVDVYSVLSNHVHKKPAAVRGVLQFDELVARVFRIFLTFLEREDDLPQVSFPAPTTFPASVRRK